MEFAHLAGVCPRGTGGVTARCHPPVTAVLGTPVALAVGRSCCACSPEMDLPAWAKRVWPGLSGVSRSVSSHQTPLGRTRVPAPWAVPSCAVPSRFPALSEPGFPRPVMVSDESGQLGLRKLCQDAWARQSHFSKSLLFWKTQPGCLRSRGDAGKERLPRTRDAEASAGRWRGCRRGAGLAAPPSPQPRAFASVSPVKIRVCPAGKGTVGVPWVFLPLLLCLSRMGLFAASEGNSLWGVKGALCWGSQVPSPRGCSVASWVPGIVPRAKGRPAPQIHPSKLFPAHADVQPCVCPRVHLAGIPTERCRCQCRGPGAAGTSHLHRHSRELRQAAPASHHHAAVLKNGAEQRLKANATRNQSKLSANH